MQLLPRAFSKKHLLPLGLLVIVVVLIAVSIYLFVQNQRLSAGNREVEKYKAEVGVLYELPNETPTLATVTDKEKLKSQQFFQHAENGDKVLIFPVAKKAMLYRPSVKKLIEVAPFFATADALPEAQLTATSSTAAILPSSPAVLQQVTVTVLNGTSTTGLTKKLSPEIEKISPGLTVTKVDQAKKTPYVQTIVVDISGKHTESAKKIATSLGSQLLQNLPIGEQKPDTDILVILGQDKQ